jgi:hypothetical protein
MFLRLLEYSVYRSKSFHETRINRTQHIATEWLKYVTLKAESKAVPLQPCRRQEGETIYLVLILDLGTRWGWGVRVTPLRALPPGKGTPVSTGQEAGWTPEPVWRLQKKLFRVCWRSNPGLPVVRSVVSNYTDWAVWNKTALEWIPNKNIVSNISIVYNNNNNNNKFFILTCWLNSYRSQLRSQHNNKSTEICHVS